MSNIEWTVPHTLTTPKGNLNLNADIGSAGAGIFVLDEQRCSAQPDLRVQSDDYPQMDGADLHDSFKGAYNIRLGMWILQAAGAPSAPACGTLLRELWDLLMLHVNSLFRPAQSDIDSGQTRLLWTPSGYGDDRMYDRVRLVEWPTPSYEGGGLVGVTFGLRSPLPYALDKTQQTDTLDTTVTNPGTAEYWPVFKVHGPVTSFTIINETTGLQIGYDSSQPGGIAIGGGEYAEISTFDNTIFLNGSGSNLDAGVYVPNSDFFPLAPGANVLSYTGDGGSCDVLWNGAWS